MSIAGIILGILGLLVSLLAALIGIIGGIPAAVLALLVILFGFLARRKANKGIPAIVIGVIALVSAVGLTIGGINTARSYSERLKSNLEQAPVLAQYVDQIKPEYGMLGFLTVTQDPEELKIIGEEVKVLLSETNDQTTAK